MNILKCTCGLHGKPRGLTHENVRKMEECEAAQKMKERALNTHTPPKRRPKSLTPSRTDDASQIPAVRAETPRPIGMTAYWWDDETGNYICLTAEACQEIRKRSGQPPTPSRFISEQKS